MGAVVLADPGDEARTDAKRRYTVPVILVLGWAGLFAYSAAYLSEDLPFRQQPADAPQPADARRADTRGRRLVMLDMPENVVPETPRQDEPPVAPSSATPSAQTAAPAVTLPATRPQPPTVASAEYVGVWGPTAFACGAPSRRRGYIPATIMQDRARAGRTHCSFHDSHRVGNAWIMAAECSDRGRHWSSQVRLVVDGDRLTWSSSRGTATYIRCGRHGG
ncbi:peptidase inhibitor family I36 protein [Methylobacterium sp. NEAU K]|uniref:peptidase inhibitor family I36 protein n=1 Tax=Methylobacterium sp. NEAU K TaxID=3064946 RepID=UPI002736E2DA|nr:peptidase inhibitor family I36 protein [Methylobacterium sp. NEAU K]MDP4005030.1 peptidase inhibitor family I36 protein [Methylobacterium sp. NEAU K]